MPDEKNTNDAKDTFEAYFISSEATDWYEKFQREVANLVAKIKSKRSGEG